MKRLLSFFLASVFVGATSFGQNNPTLDQFQDNIQGRIFLTGTPENALIVHDLVGRFGVTYQENGRMVTRAFGGSVLKKGVKRPKLVPKQEILLQDTTDEVGLAKLGIPFFLSLSLQKDHRVKLQIARVTEAQISDSDIDWKVYGARVAALKKSKNKKLVGATPFVIQVAAAVQISSAVMKKTEFKAAAEGWGAKIGGDYWSVMNKEEVRTAVSIVPSFRNPLETLAFQKNLSKKNQALAEAARKKQEEAEATFFSLKGSHFLALASTNEAEDEMTFETATP